MPPRILAAVALVIVVALVIFLAPFAWSVACVTLSWLWAHPFTFALVIVGGAIILCGLTS